MINTRVAVVRSAALDYPRDPFFNPSKSYPEYPFKEISEHNNALYDCVRKVMLLLGMDEENHGTEAWNPLGRIMGFNHTKIPVFKYALDAKKYKLFDGNPEDIRILSDKCNNFNDLYRALGCNFAPPMGWRGHIEIELE